MVAEVAPRPVGADAAMPPGPDLHPNAQMVLYHRYPAAFLRGARARHGPVFTMRLGPKEPIVVVAAPEAVPELLLADPGAAAAGAARREVLPQASARSPFGADGSVHTAVRATMAPAFAAERLTHLEPRLVSIARAHIDRWPRRRPFRLLPRMRTLATDVFVRLVLGVDDHEPSAALVHAVRRLLWTPGNPPIGVPAPGDGALGRAVSGVFARRLEPIERLLAEAFVARRSGPEDGDDLLGLLVRRNPRMSSRELCDELTVVLAAAQEPPSIALTNAVLELGRRPAVKDRFLGASEREQDAVVNEVLRLRPSAQAVLRRLESPFDVGGHRLAPGTIVALPSILLQQDRSRFTHPKRFEEHRFDDGIPETAPYFPFGGGARRCIAEPLARAELRLVVPLLLERFDVRPVRPRPERMVVRGTVLVPHRSGLVTMAPTGATGAE
jgi:cytochrome P450 family 135